MEGTTQRSRRFMVVLISALAGAALFLSLYGIHVLNPTYTDWLMDGGSLSKGFLGWRLFQSTNWQVPPGVMASLGYPQHASIAAVDSVPLLAVIGKLVSLFYEGSFQYFGWWGLFCFVMQGVFGALICLRITRSTCQAVLGSFLFLLSPVLWQNTFFSAGLAGHWLLLAMLLPLVCLREFSAKSKHPAVIWGLLGAVSVSIHAQLALVCAIFCVGYCLYAALESNKWGKFRPFATFLLTSLAAAWLLGMFQSSNLFDIHPFGISPLALWNPLNYSRVLKSFSNPGEYQYAGFAYLGFGLLVLFALALAWLAKSFFSRKSIGRALVDDLLKHRAHVAALSFIFVAFLVFGLAQPLVYMLVALTLYALAHKMSKKLLTAALAYCLCLQAYDASTVFEARRLHYDRVVQYAQATGAEDWAELMQTGAWSTVLISPAALESPCLAPMVEAIAQGGKTLNTLSYVADSDYTKWDNARGNPQEDMVFVFAAQELLREDDKFQSVFSRIGYLYQWDEMVVGFVRPTLLPYAQILGKEDITLFYRYPIGKSLHLKGGEDIGGIRYIYPRGLSYGPYLTLAPGQYELRVSGEHLDEAKFSFAYKDGVVDPSETVSLPTERVYRLDVSAAVTDFEVLIENGTAQPLFFSAMTVTQLD